MEYKEMAEVLEYKFLGIFKVDKELITKLIAALFTFVGTTIIAYLQGGTTGS